MLNLKIQVGMPEALHKRVQMSEDEHNPFGDGPSPVSASSVPLRTGASAPNLSTLLQARSASARGGGGGGGGGANPFGDDEASVAATPVPPAGAVPRAPLWNSMGLQLSVDPAHAAPLDEAGALPDEVQVFEKIRAVLRGAQGCRALGYLSGTTYQLCFKPDVYPLPPAMRHLPAGFLSVPMASIRKVERGAPAAGQPPVVDVVCKDVRTLTLLFENESDADTVLMRLRMVAFPAKMEYLFAFSGGAGSKRLKKGEPAPAPAQLPGWDVYSFGAEVERLGVLHVRHPATGDPLFRVSEVNRDFGFCPTYPPLLVFPARAPDAFMTAVAGFRSKCRVPVLTWMHPCAKTTLWRCSQPKVGVQGNKCAQDEAMLAFIREANLFTRMGPTAPLLVVDCRPKANAIANNLGGGGYESYLGTVLEFCALRARAPPPPSPSAHPRTLPASQPRR